MIPQDPKTRPWERKPANIWLQKTDMGWWPVAFFVSSIAVRHLWGIGLSLAWMALMLVGLIFYRHIKAKRGV